MLCAIGDQPQAGAFEGSLHLPKFRLEYARNDQRAVYVQTDQHPF